MPNHKYKKEHMEAQYIVQRKLYPYRMKTDNPYRLQASLEGYFRRNRLNANISIDPDKDSVWIWGEK